MLRERVAVALTASLICLAIAPAGTACVFDHRSPVEVSLISPSRSYFSGEAIRADATVTNPNDAPLEVRFGSHCQSRLIVFDSTGREWNPFHPPGMVCTAAETTWIMEPRERRYFQYTWTQEGEDGRDVPAPGTYVLRFELLPGFARNQNCCRNMYADLAVFIDRTPLPIVSEAPPHADPLVAKRPAEAPAGVAPAQIVLIGSLLLMSLFAPLSLARRKR